MNPYTAETIPCSMDAVTVPPERVNVEVVVPRDSEWSGFSDEMAEILREVA